MAVRVHESDLGEIERFASGGMAIVSTLPTFTILEYPDVAMVYKKFKSSVRPIPIFGLEGLIRLLSDFHPQQRKAIEGSFNWPLRVVTDDYPGAAGVILPRLDDSYFVRLRNGYGEVKRMPAEGQYLTVEESYCRKRELPFANMEQRFGLCDSLAVGIGLLHRAGVVYGDLSLRNFLFRLSPSPTVMFVDCDAMRLSGTSAAMGRQPHTPDWEPPEALRASREGDLIGFSVQNQASDRYKLGLAILRVLTPGSRSSMSRDPAAAKGVLPHHLYRLLERGLSGRPDERPTAKEWHEAFRR